MILLDTSVIIEALRSRTAKGVRKLLADEGAVCGIVRAEVLHGARGENEWESLNHALNAFAQVPTPEAIWSELGRYLYAMRVRGISVPVSDALIATVAVHNQITLWTLDGHFQVIQQVIPDLRLSNAAVD